MLTDATKHFQPTGPQVFPTSSTASCSWLGVGGVKPRNSGDFFSSRRNEMTLNFRDRKEQIHFPFTQQEPPPPFLLRAASVSSPLELNSEGCGQELLLGTTVSPDSNHALSLLSSSLQQPHTEASPEEGISLFNPSLPLHPHHPDYDYSL